MSRMKREAAASAQDWRAEAIERYVGSRIRLRRRMLGMSQASVADALGVSYQQVQKYETGMSRIGAGRLHMIACILGTPVTFFFPELEEGRAAPQAEDFDSATDLMSSSDAVELSVAAMQVADPDFRRSLIQLVRSMAGR